MKTINVDIKPKGNSLGVVSLVLGVVAFLFCWIPLVGAVGIPLSGLGVLLGMIGLVVAVFRRGASIGYPIAGTVISGLALLVAWSMTGALIAGFSAAGEELAKDRQQRSATNQVTVKDGSATTNNSTSTEEGNTDTPSSESIDTPKSQSKAAAPPPEPEGLRPGTLSARVTSRSV